MLGTIAGAIIGLILVGFFAQDRLLYMLSVSIAVTVVFYTRSAYLAEIQYQLFLLISTTVVDTGSTSGAESQDASTPVSVKPEGELSLESVSEIIPKLYAAQEAFESRYNTISTECCEISAYKKEWDYALFYYRQIIGGAIYFGYQKYEEYFNNPWTRNGQVRANVIKVAVSDNQFVRKGDLLFQIDPSTYEVALSQAEVSLERAVVSSRGKKIEYDRLLDIRARDKGAVSHKDLVRRQIAYEESLLQIKVSEQQLNAAKLNMAFTQIFASVDGYVSNLDIKEGTQAVANQPLIALVDIGSFWVFGYFRESQLENIRIGDAARVTLMAYPEQPIEAVVDSLGWGIAPKDGSVGYNLLPNVNPVFQWIRLAQRIPVRISLRQLPEGIDLRFGLTASIMVMKDSERK